MRCCVLIVAMLSLSATIFGDEVGGFRQEVGSFPRQKYSPFSFEGSERGYSISRAIVMPTREWVVFSVLTSDVKNPERAVVIAIGAYHVSSGQVQHLQFVSAGGRTDSEMYIIDDLGFIPLGDNRLMFLTELSQPRVKSDVRPVAQEKGTESTRDERSSDISHTYHFWEWDLSTKKVRLRKEDVPIRVAQAVRLGPCCLSWIARSESDPTDGRLSVRDKRSGKVATVDLQLGTRGTLNSSQTYAATGDPCTFAVCNPWNLERDRTLEVSCVDPNAPQGIRWRIDKAALEEHALGRQIVGAALLDNSFDPAPELYLMLLLMGKDYQYHVVLVRIDARAGKVDKEYRLPLDSAFWDPDQFVLSPSKRRVVAERHNSDRSDNGVFTRYRVIELESGNYKDTDVIDWETPIPRLCGFINETDVIIAGDYALSVLNTTDPTQHRELFRLVEFKDD